jgi:hypothetical protein
LLSQKITVFCIVPFFVSSMIDDTEKLSLMTHFSYCLRNNEIWLEALSYLKKIIRACLFLVAYNALWNRALQISHIWLPEHHYTVYKHIDR